MRKIVLATRKSPLALAQTEMVAAQLRKALGVETEFLKIVTTGDKQTEWSLEKKGGKGLFTSELEQALLRGEADVAVHSTKDLPGGMLAGLAIAGYLPRADPRDVLVLRKGVESPKLVATGSPRRRLQLAMLFPETQFTEIRGNVDTRLRKISEGLAEGTVLAAAGLARLGIHEWQGLDFLPMDFGQMVPAVGQGAIAIQSRAEDAANFAPAFDPTTARHVGLERAFQNAMGGGCQTAFAAFVTEDTLYFFHEEIGLRSLPLSPDDFLDPTATATRTLIYLGFKL
ncbi:MAG TPA: hydroxymethylbilane synthase [Opitutaceae bacterium]|nr:hydroxymethylbilane synthase [Opitutaceae bacterium]